MLFDFSTGSIAAAIQSSIGSVVAGSPFAIAQSIAMGGAIPVVGFVFGGAIVAAAAIAAARGIWGGGDNSEVCSISLNIAHFSQSLRTMMTHRINLAMFPR